MKALKLNIYIALRAVDSIEAVVKVHRAMYSTASDLCNRDQSTAWEQGKAQRATCTTEINVQHESKAQHREQFVQQRSMYSMRARHSTESNLYNRDQCTAWEQGTAQRAIAITEIKVQHESKAQHTEQYVYVAQISAQHESKAQHREQ